MASKSLVGQADLVKAMTPEIMLVLVKLLKVKNRRMTTKVQGPVMEARTTPTEATILRRTPRQPTKRAVPMVLTSKSFKHLSKTTTYLNKITSRPLKYHKIRTVMVTLFSVTMLFLKS